MPDVEAIVPTFFVRDVRQAAEWYERTLGFRRTFLQEEPGGVASYCGLRLGAVTLHLALREGPAPAVRGACYLRLRSGVDAYVAGVEAAGQALTSRLKNQSYGMREATVRDPDGNDLYIGQPLSGPG